MTVVCARPRLDEILTSAKNIYVSACASEIADAPNLFRRHRPTDATVTGLFSPLVNRRSYADPEIGLRVRSFFLTRELRRHLALGLVDYCPWRYRIIDRWLSAPGRFDTALVMLSPPGPDGRCSLGPQVDFLPAFIGKIERVVGFINPNMPRTAGDAGVSYRALSAVLDYDRPLETMVQKAPDPTAIRIAERIAELVPDRATVQFGVGQIPSQVIARLGDHRGLSVHSGVVDDNILSLEASGALDRTKPIVTGTAVGTPCLYEALDGNARFSFRAVSHTHAFGTIAALKRFTAVNSVLQVDLLGQASAESSGGRLVASPGGLPDFARGALESEGGASIVAVRAKSAGRHPPGVAPLLPAPHAVTATAADADIIVTEHGAARVRDLSLDARAEAIMAIADPEDQAHLAAAWARLREGFVARS